MSIMQAARAFADREGWDWDDLHETEDTSHGWGQDHIIQQVSDVENDCKSDEDMEAWWDGMHGMIWRVAIVGCIWIILVHGMWKGP